MLVEAKDLAAVGAEPFEHAVAIQQAVIEDADLGVFLRDELAADVDLARHAIDAERIHHRTSTEKMH